MSGTIIPGQTLVSEPVNRQTIPYADRPFVVIRNGRGYLTQDGYQFLTRILQGVTATVGNVGNIIEVTNTVIADLSTIEAEIGTLFTDIAEIEAEIAGLGTLPPAPPQVMPPQVVQTPLGPVTLPALNSGQPVAPPVVPFPAPLPLGPSPAPAFPQAWAFITSTKVSAVASVPFLLPAGFRRYALVLQGVTVSNSGAFMGLRVSIDGGATFISTSSYAQLGYYTNNVPAMVPFNTAGTSAFLGVGQNNTATSSLDAHYEFWPGDGTLGFFVTGLFTNYTTSPGWYTGRSTGIIFPGAVVNAVQAFVSAGTFSGEFTLLGLR